MRYGLVKIGEAPDEPSVTDAAIAAYVRAYLPDEEAHVQALRAQAEQEVERVSGRAILSRGFRMDLAQWPLLEPQPVGPSCCKYDRAIRLPRNPVVSVESVKYYDTDDVLQTLDGALYEAATSYEPGFVYLRKGFTWPCVADRPDAIQIEFTAGYGDETEDTPALINQAILLLCRHFYAGGNPSPVADKVSDYDTAQSILIGQRVEGFVA